MHFEFDSYQLLLQISNTMSTENSAEFWITENHKKLHLVLCMTTHAWVLIKIYHAIFYKI